MRYFVCQAGTKHPAPEPPPPARTVLITCDCEYGTVSHPAYHAGVPLSTSLTGPPWTIHARFEDLAKEPDGEPADPAGWEASLGSRGF